MFNNVHICQSVYANCNHPGVVQSELVRHLNPVIRFMVKSVSINVDDGALAQLYLATSPEIEEKEIHGKYYVPYGEPATPQRHPISKENQTQLWELSEKILSEKIPGYTGAGI
jgi:retinol dehydrogenase-12